MDRRRSLFPAAVLAVLVAAPSSSARDDARAPWPARGWPRATPASQGLDPKPLGELVAGLRAGDTMPGVHSLLVVKNGYLVLEEYFDGWSADRPHTLQSVSKSVTSALIGIAVGHGALRLDEKVLEVASDLTGVTHIDARKRAMTVEHLLTMRSGTDYREGFAGSPHSQLNRLARGWDRFVLSRPMVRDPGSHFQYDSGGVILLSSLLQARTGQHADAYAAEHLFAPLGIETVRWSGNSEGHPHTGGGLHLRPRDLARFGLLYLRGGRWRERQVVPASWVERSIRRHVDFASPKGRAVGYGYLWWIQPPPAGGAGRLDVYSARGFMGQYLFVDREHDLLAVVTAGAHGRQSAAPVAFFDRSIVAAVVR